MGVLFSLLRSLLGVAGARPALHFGAREAVVTVRTRSASSSDETETVTLEKFVKTRVPSLLEDYKPAWWLPTCVSGLQTLHSVLMCVEAGTARRYTAFWATLPSRMKSCTSGM